MNSILDDALPAALVGTAHASHGGTNACIVCTSTLELGIDVGDLDLVFQANAPSTVSSFLQRLGRTGRRPGTRASATFLCEAGEVALQAVALVELARRGWVEPVPVNRRCWPVLVHQLLALVLQYGAVDPEDAWRLLSRVPDFSGIDRRELDALVEHLVARDFLYATGGRLAIGDETERVFGRKNFMELYAVFSSPQLYRVETEAGYLIGYLEPGFVDKLVAEMSSFLLSGRAWTVVLIDHGNRKIRVTTAPRGRKPSWGSFAPQLLSHELCQEMARVLASEKDIPYLDAPAREALTAFRADLGPLLRRPGFHVQQDPDRLLWWTFAGGQINHALRLGIQLQEVGWKAVADNFKIKIEGNGLTVEELRRLLKAMAELAFWNDEERQRRLLHLLPDYRLSKFQQALPIHCAAEMIRAYLLDIDGATALARSCSAP